MAKLRIPKSKQIIGLRKAIANRKTPKQFIPSMKKRLAKLTASAIFLFCLGLLANPAAAQTPVIIQPSAQTLAPNGTACTGAAQVFTVNNKNQTIHYVSIIPSVTAAIYVEIDGFDVAGNSYRISDLDAVTPLTGISFNGFSLTGYGYYPTVKVSVTCANSSGTFSLTYTGSSTTSVNVVGSYQTAQLAKEIFNLTSIAGVGGATSPNLQTPFGNSLGVINVEASNVGGTVSIGINCISLLFNTANTSFNYTIPADGTVHELPVPASSCPIMNAGASQKASTSISWEYLFEQTGFNPTPGPGTSFTHFATTSITSVKATSGTVYSLNINTPASGTITLWDLAAAACTGTPSTNTVAIITPGTTLPIPLNYGVLFQNGICVKSSSASIDFTVGWQ